MLISQKCLEPTFIIGGKKHLLEYINNGCGCFNRGFKTQLAEVIKSSLCRVLIGSISYSEVKERTGSSWSVSALF